MIPVHPLAQLATEEERAKTKIAKRELLKAPEVVAIFGLMIFWTIVLVPFDHPIATPIAWAGVLLIGGVICWIAVDNGSHGFVGVMAVFLLCLSAAGVAADGWSTPLGLIPAGATAYVATDLLRLNFARRRGAELSQEVVTGTLVSSSAVCGASMLSILLLTALSADTADRSWVWVPIASGILVGLAAALTFGLGRSSARRRKLEASSPDVRDQDPAPHGWKPGEVMLPPPIVE